MPHSLHLDSPLAGVAAYDLTTATGLALLRRFDAQFHRLPPAERADAVRSLALVLPLASRGEGLLVLPGGALAWRQGESVLVADSSSSVGVTTSAPALRGAAAVQSGTFFIHHTKNGLQMGQEAVFPAQSVTLTQRASLYADILPGLAGWRGPALIHWHQHGAAVWEMVPAPPPLALAVSLTGEVLQPGSALPRFLWAAGGGEEIYQHLSSGLSAHLDEWLASEISDALRFALIAHWTDGEDSLASRLADGLASLPSAFAADPSAPAGMETLADWPDAVPMLGGDRFLLGLSAAEAGEAWTGSLPRQALEVWRDLLPPRSALISERRGSAVAALDTLAADRLVRGSARSLAVLAPLAAEVRPGDLLHLVERVALRLGAPVLLAVPAWGLFHQYDPEGFRAAGNGPAFGLGAGLECFEPAE